jgi:large subunit ribosomal protein L17
MRHGKKINHLGRKAAHRNAMLSNMACSLLTHKRIKTTVAKAKALRVFVEPILTKSKEDSTHSRRVVFGYLQDKNTVSELFRDIAPKIADRPGGYTRILKLGSRAGDNAEMCLIELVDYNELLLSEKTEKKTTRRKRKSPKTEGKATEAASTADAKAKPEAVAAKEVKAETTAAPEAKAEAPLAVTEDKVEKEVEQAAPKAEKAPETKKDKTTTEDKEDSKKKDEQ